jgi:hypothetical protein
MWRKGKEVDALSMDGQAPLSLSLSDIGVVCVCVWRERSFWRVVPRGGPFGVGCKMAEPIPFTPVPWWSPVRLEMFV